MTSLYSQGDLIEVDFDPATGHEPKKRRPALVVSTDRFNALISSLTVVCPITSVDNRHPLHIKLAPENAVDGYVCVEQLRAIDPTQRRGEKLDAALDGETMGFVLDALGAVFGI